jgi:hypothetical protein
MKTFLIILFVFLCVMFLGLAGFAERMAVAFTYMLLSVMSLLCVMYLYFGKIQLK